MQKGNYNRIARAARLARCTRLAREPPPGLNPPTAETADKTIKSGTRQNPAVSGEGVEICVPRKQILPDLDTAPTIILNAWAMSIPVHRP